MPEQSMETWVLIVDDEPVVRSSLRRYFAATSDIRVLAEASDGATALAQLDATTVDVVLADIHMPTMDGVALLRKIQERPQPPAFVAITALDSDDTMLQVLAGGGAGYILKSARPQSIINAVREATTGGTSVSPQSLSRLVGYIPPAPPAAGDVAEDEHPDQELTVTERQILTHLCRGLSNAAIARTLNYAEGTVKKYVSQLITRFDADSRLSLAVTAIRMGW